MNYVIITILELLFAIFLVFINRKFFWKEFKTAKKYIIALSLFFIVLTFVFNNGLSFLPSWHEWQELYEAKHLNSQTFFQAKQGLVYPVILAPLFKIFGANPEAAVLLNLFLAGACIFLVFFLTKIVFKNDLISLFTAAIFGLSPPTLWYFFIMSGWPALTGFWLLCLTITLVLFFKEPQNFSLGILGMLFILLLSQTRPEFFILILLMPLGFLLNLKTIISVYKKISLPKLVLLILIFILVFVVFSAPIFAKSVQRKYQGGGTCGFFTSETKLLTGGISTSNSVPVNQIDRAIKSIFNNRFSIYYIADDLSFLKSYLFIPPFFFILPFLIIGFLVGLKNNFKTTILILFAVLLPSLIYLLDCTYFLFRYITPLCGPLIVFAGGGIKFLFEKVGSGFAQKYSKIALIFLAVLFFFINFNDLTKVRNLIPPSYFGAVEIGDYKEIKEISRGLNAAESIIVLMHANEEGIWEFLGYKYSQSLSGEISREGFWENKDGFYQTLNLELGNYLNSNKKTYFIYNKSSCRLDKHPYSFDPFLCEVTNFILNNYKLNEVCANKTYSLYKFEKL